MVLPAAGAVSGSSTAVTVMGSNFFHTRSTSCRFGSKVVPGRACLTMLLLGTSQDAV
jgi:hypothetical protein